MRFATLHRWLLYFAFAGVALSGLAWAWLDVVHGPGPSADGTAQLAKTWLGKAHGAFAMLALAGFGSALAQHIPVGWSGGVRRVSGLALVATALLLAVTGFLLYYAAGEVIRDRSTWLHIGVGVAACLAFAGHLRATLWQRRNPE